MSLWFHQQGKVQPAATRRAGCPNRARALAALGPVRLDLSGEVGTVAGIKAAVVKAQIAKSRGRDLLVTINSAGGNVAEAKAIYEALRAHDGRVTTRAVGTCASAATLILLGGASREAVRGTRIMIHRAEADPVDRRLRWTSDRLKAFAAVIERTDSDLLDIYTKRTGMPRNWHERNMQDDDPFPLSVALSTGYVHRLIDP